MGAGGPLAGPAVLGAQASALSEGAAVISTGVGMAEPPYTAWQIAGLAVCSVLLSLCGIMMYDLVRSMWSWEQPSTIGSGLMNTIGRWVGL